MFVDFNSLGIVISEFICGFPLFVEPPLKFVNQTLGTLGEGYRLAWVCGHDWPEGLNSLPEGVDLVGVTCYGDSWFL